MKWSKLMCVFLGFSALGWCTAPTTNCNNPQSGQVTVTVHYPSLVVDNAHICITPTTQVTFVLDQPAGGKAVLKVNFAGDPLERPFRKHRFGHGEGDKAMTCTSTDWWPKSSGHVGGYCYFQYNIQVLTPRNPTVAPVVIPDPDVVVSDGTVSTMGRHKRQ